MNAHHLKQYPHLQHGRDGYKVALHDVIVNRLGLSPFRPLIDHPFIESTKEGRFHQSTCAIALYSNAFTQKAVFPSDQAPFGYIYKRYGELFSFGVYRRHDGCLFGSILPLSSNLESISEFTHLAMNELPIRGVYVRFLRWEQHARLVSEFGFKPAKEEPWLPDAPEEDESLSHSRVDLENIFSTSSSQPLYAPLRRNVGRAMNFLNRNKMEYRLIPLTVDDLPLAWDMVRMHFDMIEGRGKLVGSTSHDYLGLLHSDIISLKSVHSYLGMLGSLPVSVFVTEANGSSNGEPCISGYAGITLRNISYPLGSSPRALIKTEEHLESEGSVSSLSTGSSAIPTYAFFRLFSLFLDKGYRYFYMGGSEHADIDTWKHKRMGAEKDPTYWAVYT